jgi:hypothetical protein
LAKQTGASTLSVVEGLHRTVSALTALNTLPDAVENPFLLGSLSVGVVSGAMSVSELPADTSRMTVAGKMSSVSRSIGDEMCETGIAHSSAGIAHSLTWHQKQHQQRANLTKKDSQLHVLKDSGIVVRQKGFLTAGLEPSFRVRALRH